LYFSRSVSTQLVVASPTGIYVNGGTLDCGTESDPIPDTVTHKIYMKSTADNQNLLNDVNNATVTFYGSSSYYGNVRDSTLYADGDGTTTIKVTGDVTGWRVNQELVIHKNQQFSAWQTDSILVTISSVGSYNGSYTTLVVSTAISSDFKAGGCVANLSRNIEIGKFGALRGVNQTNTQAPRIVLNANQKFNNVSVIGLYIYYCYAVNATAEFKNCVFRNSIYNFWISVPGPTPPTNLIFDNNIIFTPNSALFCFLQTYQKFEVNNLLVIASSGGITSSNFIIKNSKFIGSNVCFGSPSNQFITCLYIEDCLIKGCGYIFTTVDVKETYIKNCIIDKCYCLVI
jgi:hypothetical protein